MLQFNDKQDTPPIQGHEQSPKKQRTNDYQIPQDNKISFVPSKCNKDEETSQSYFKKRKRDGRLTPFEIFCGTDGTGDTALHKAAHMGDLELTKLLLQSGFDVNILNKDKQSALHVALKTNVSVAKILVEHGAKININDEEQFAEFGIEITPTAMKLFCSADKKNKNYPFLETIINKDQINEYLSILQSTEKSVREKFSIWGSVHWYCADIKIDKNKHKIKLLILDSLGVDCIMWTNTLTGKIQATFPEYKFSIYINATQRQNDGYSCSSFTLNDIKDLHKINHYLPEKYSGDIFNFCKKNTLLSRTTITGMILNFTFLPLKMMRLTQSSTLLENIIPERPLEEQSLPVNKKGQTALESSELGFLNKRNIRARLKLEKMLDKTSQYLMDTPLDQISETMEEFDLSGLKKRLLKNDTFTNDDAASSSTPSSSTSQRRRP